MVMSKARMRLIWACVVIGLPALAATKAEIPERWFERARGYEQAEELRKKIQAPMVIYIESTSPAGPSSRSRAFHDQVLRKKEMRDFLTNYIKVKLTLPGDPATQELAEKKFRIQYGPRMVVVRADGQSYPITTHIGSGDNRQALPIEEIQRNIIVAATPLR